MNDQEPKPKVFWKHPILLIAWLVCAGIGFAVVRALTGFPIWICIVVALPVGLGLLSLAVFIAES